MVLVRWHNERYIYEAISLLGRNFYDRIMLRSGSANWPSRSCNLTLLDNFLWSFRSQWCMLINPPSLLPPGWKPAFEIKSIMMGKDKAKFFRQHDFRKTKAMTAVMCQQILFSEETPHNFRTNKFKIDIFIGKNSPPFIRYDFNLPLEWPLFYFFLYGILWNGAALGTLWFCV